MTYLPKSQNTSSSFILNTPSTKTDLDFTEAPQVLIPQVLTPQYKYKKYQDLINHPDIWKMVMDRKDHKYEKNSYDEGRNDVITFISDSKTQIDFVPGEKGYLENMLNALNYMLNTLGQTMSSNEYAKFHDFAVSGVENMYSNSLGFRTTGQGCFDISENEPCNMSIEGFGEWKQKKSSEWQSDKLTRIKSTNEKFTENGRQIFNPGVQAFLWNDIEEASMWEYITEENKIDKLISNRHNMRFIANVFDNPDDACQTVFDEYYKMMNILNNKGTFPGCKNEDASLEDKKLEIIARICQNLDQMHLFKDGNIRTIGFLLLNKFLIENGLSPTIMYDPNMIDLRSIQEIIEEIKKGQTYFQQTFFPTQQ